MTTAVKHQCKHGCGYEHAKRGPMNLHELYHCKKKQGGNDAQMNSEKKKPSSSSRGSGTPATKTCACDDGGSWRFLSRNDYQEAQAIVKGYKKICVECEEVV